jgi:glycosyltransferase involved in cell wall biosynthesis
MQVKNKYTIVVPVFNSGSGLFQLHQEITRALYSQIAYDIVYVDDYSQDESWRVLNDIKNQDKNHKITLIRLSKNFGQHAATLCGFASASGDYILTMDDDLAVLPEEFKKLIKEREESGAQVVYGEYVQHESFGRKLFKFIYKTLARLEGGNKGRGSSFRLLEANLARKLAENHNHFVFIDEFLLWYTDKVSFVTVENHPSPIRKSRYRITRLIDTTGKVILYSTGIILVVIGIAGIYIGEIFKQVKNRPLYIIDGTFNID